MVSDRADNLDKHLSVCLDLSIGVGVNRTVSIEGYVWSYISHHHNHIELRLSSTRNTLCLTLHQTQWTHQWDGVFYCEEQGWQIERHRERPSLLIEPRSLCSINQTSTINSCQKNEKELKINKMWRGIYAKRWDIMSTEVILDPVETQIEHTSR